MNNQQLGYQGKAGSNEQSFPPEEEYEEPKYEPAPQVVERQATTGPKPEEKKVEPAGEGEEEEDDDYEDDEPHEVEAEEAGQPEKKEPTPVAAPAALPEGLQSDNQRR